VAVCFSGEEGDVIVERPEFYVSRDDRAPSARLLRPRSEPITARDSDIPVPTDAFHDLNNLLTVVLGSLEQLHRQPLDERGYKQLGRAEWGVLQACQLAREMLASVRGEHEGATVIDLNEAVNAFGAMVGQVAAGGVTLAVETPPRCLPARLDAERLQRALLNLVRNAAEAMPGSSITIRTSGHLADGLGRQPTVAISVSDTGPGASSGPGAATPFRNGTEHLVGMLRRFAAESGGQVEIETGMHQGATVLLVFPHIREAPHALS
jgi:signal transduction histidine kinase